MLACVRRSWRAARLSIVVAAVMMIGLTGCGGKATVKAATSNHARAVQPAPTYRAGQYCLTSKEAKYRTAGLTCKHHHLARR
jgi:hypothetical protein